jgi:hypothetical protein
MAPVSTLRPGDQLASQTHGTRVIVIRAPSGGAPEITCAGAPMVPAATVPPPAPGSAAEAEPVTLIGKRYVTEDGELELLCIASGSGELAADGIRMTTKAAKSLPASD